MKIKLKLSASQLEKQMVKKFNQMVHTSPLIFQHCFHSGDTGLIYTFESESEAGKIRILINNDTISTHNFVIQDMDNWVNISISFKKVKSIIFEGQKFPNVYALHQYVHEKYCTLTNISKCLPIQYIDVSEKTKDLTSLKEINQFLDDIFKSDVYAYQSSKFLSDKEIQIVSPTSKNTLKLQEDGAIELSVNYGRLKYNHMVHDITEPTSCSSMKESYQELFNELFKEINATTI